MNLLIDSEKYIKYKTNCHYERNEESVLENRRKNNRREKRFFASLRSALNDIFRLCNIYPIMILIFIFTDNVLYAGTPSSTDSIRKTRIVIADVKIAQQLKDFSEIKIEAALFYAMNLVGGYEIISLQERDSVAKLLAISGKEPTAMNIAKKLSADKMLFIRVNSYQSMMRVDITSINLTAGNLQTDGVGYALIHYKESGTNKNFNDPALLTALQRAFAISEQDKMMFAELKGKLRTLPAETLVIGSIEFQDAEDLPSWGMLKDKIGTSFYLCESIFEAAKNSPNYAVYDLATRDSIYTTQKLFIPENYRPASQNEIEALGKFDVQNYITGELIRTEYGARLTLHLCKIENNELYELKSASGSVMSDRNDFLKKAAQETVKKLLE